MVAEQGWSPERGTCEGIADVYVPQVVKRTIEVPKMAEQILDVPVPETVEEKLPETVSDDRIQQRTAEHIAVIPVPQDVDELVEVFRVPKDRIQQRLAEQIIDETPDISLAEKIVERPVTQTQQAVNTDVQHVVNTVEAEMSVTQFNDKVVDIPVVARREVSQLQFDDHVVLVVQVPRVCAVKKTAEIPQLPVVDVPVVLVVQAPLVQVRVVKKTVEDPVSDRRENR